MSKFTKRLLSFNPFTSENIKSVNTTAVGISTQVPLRNKLVKIIYL